MAGQKKMKRQRFFQEHPYCCFCGGTTPSEEEDHIPSRTIFNNRHWPEGYVFPSCKACNEASRHDEQVVGMLSRLYSKESTPQSTTEIERSIHAVARHYPEIINEMRPTARAYRNAVRKYGLQLAPGQSYAETPIISIGPMINEAVTNFSRKLFCALYYKHTGTILPSQGGIAVRWFTNAEIWDENTPLEFLSFLSGVPKLERSSKVLNDQFFYRWTLTDAKESGVFFTVFRDSFATLGYVHIDIDKMKLPQATEVLQPYVRDQG